MKKFFVLIFTVLLCIGEFFYSKLSRYASSTYKVTYLFTYEVLFVVALGIITGFIVLHKKGFKFNKKRFLFEVIPFAILSSLINLQFIFNFRFIITFVELKGIVNFMLGYLIVKSMIKED